ncbi:T9SS type A sorting domain-containing protein [Flavobacterium sp. CYK-4]|uniref:T9SS type A sorting domain-containing protein n=1 Tax=Flavobacterium lotistagni TaxID=2709660 RepID=UPI00140C17C3|nr:T9SS type A sorting domain-containing protein [Flavobacterium lotistagni]NHM07660.1 T9SS type A sorting domain-containing protein [Flavobacterium lotistagni]
MIVMLLFAYANDLHSQCAYTGTPLTQVGSTYTFCVDNLTTITTGTVNAGQYVVVDVVKGFDYTFSVGNVFNGGRNENLTVLNATTNASVTPVATASGTSGATLNWTASISGQIKLLLSHSACTNDNRTGGALTLTLTGIGNTQDSETAYGTDQWIGHVYNWAGAPAPGGASPSSPTASYPFTTDNYVGYYPVTTETLSEGFGGNNSCLPIYSNGAIRTNMYTETFAIRYRMRSTKVGCYEAAFSGDDGIRIYVDGVKVFDEWKEQVPTNYDNVLLYLNGNSEIIFDFYENGGQNVAGFSLTPFDPASNAVTPSLTTVCSGAAPTLDGSVYAYNGTTVNPSLSFQWQSSSDNITFTNISGATTEDYTPPAITTTTGNITRYYRRIVTASAATASGCTFTSNTATVVTSQGIAAVPGAITGTVTQCAALTGQTYSVAPVNNATSYNWTVPTGWTITAGAGTNAITVTTGAVGQNGNITVVSVNGCGSSAARSLAVTVNTSVAGTVSANQTICSGTSPGNIILTGNTGTIQWQSSPDNITFTNIAGATGATLTSVQMGAINATTYYRAVVTNGGCASVNTASVTVTTNAVSVAGTVSANQSICTGTQPGNITLTGNTGTIQWQSSTNNTTFTNIAGATAATLTSGQMGTLTATRYYRAVVTSGVCASAVSSSVTVTVSTASVAGTVSANQTICSGTQPGNIALTGNTGTIQWQSSTNNTTFTNIAGATGATLTSAQMGTISATTYYRAVVTNGGCASVNTASVTVTTNAVSVAGTVSANQTICSGTSPGNITLTGNTGTIQWQSSTNNTTFTNIAGATAATLTSGQMGTLTATRYYRAVVTSGVCASVTSSSVTVTVSTTSVAGTVSANQTICSGTQPGNISLTGNTGTIQWQSSTNNTTFTNIAGATGATLTSAQMGTLTATRYYRAVVTNSPCAAVNSASVTVTVSTASVAGTVSANQTICSGTSPGNITLTGNTGTIQWQSSSDNITFTNITGATAATLTSAQMGTLTTTRYYRAVVTSGVCASVTSSSVTVNVVTSVAGTVSANQIICTGTQPGNITLTGNTGNIQWQSSTNNTTFTNIAGATSATLTSAQMGTLTATRYYRAVVTNSPCAAVNSASVTVTVSTASIAGTVSANQTICSGTSPGNITLTGNTGTIHWQSSPDNITFTNIAGATGATLTSVQMGAINATTYYRAVVTNGGCASVNTASVTVTTNAVSVAGTVSANQSICTGTQPGNITLTGNTGTIQWQSSTNNTTFTNIAGATAATLTSGQMGTLTATRYYRAVVTSGVCASAVSSSVTVTVSTASVAGTVSANQTICSGTQPGNIALTGNTGTIQWQSSTNNTTFTNIAGATGATLTSAQMGTISATTYYRAVVTNGGCASVNTSVVTISTGATTTWNGSAWSNGTPSSTSAVVFTANYTTTTNLEACTINVTNNASVIISSGNNVTINGVLTVDAGSNFTLKSNANLLQNTNVVNSGNIIVERTSAPLMRQDYVMWSSPVDNQFLQPFSPETLPNRFYTYDPNTNLYVAVATPSAATFETAKGYLIRMPNNHPATPTNWTGAFIGNPHNGDVNVAVTNGGYNAIGNPYPSAIDADTFIAANGLTEALYFWRKTNNTVTTSYATYTLAGGTSNSGSDPLSLVPNGIIQPCQGFIAKATSSTISFTNSMRIGNSNAPFLRMTNERSRIWLNLTSTEGFFGQTLVAYMPNATAGIDPAIDGRFFNDSPTALTSLIDNQEYAIQGRGTFTSNDIVPLGFKSQLGGTYTIAINNIDGLFASAGQNIYLNDNFTNTLHDLTAAPYVFASEAGVFNSRFELRYENLLTVKEGSFTNNSVVVYKQDNEAVVHSSNVLIDKIEIYDVNGRLLLVKEAVNAGEVRFSLPTVKGVLMVKVTSEQNQVVVKKIVN